MIQRAMALLSTVSVSMSTELQVLVLHSPCKESGIGASLQNARVSGRQDGRVGVEVPGGKFNRRANLFLGWEGGLKLEGRFNLPLTKTIHF